MAQTKVPHIILGADHQGRTLLAAVHAYLARRGVTTQDVSGTRADDDYPRIARKVVGRMRKTHNSMGVLICGSGNGMVMAANRFSRIRAALAPSAAYANKARKDEDANVIVLPAWWITPAQARAILAAWLGTRASTAVRHVRRRRQLELRRD